MAKERRGGKAKHVGNDGQKPETSWQRERREMHERLEYLDRKEREERETQQRPGDKWLADMEKRRESTRKQIAKEQAEHDAAAERIKAALQTFDPDREPSRANRGDSGGYTREYQRSYLMYREEQAIKAWEQVTKLRAGREATFDLKRLGNAGMTDETLRIRRRTKAEGGGLEVIGRVYMGVFGSRSRRNFIEAIKDW